jgi:hypothetical protein
MGFLFASISPGSQADDIRLGWVGVKHADRTVVLASSHWGFAMLTAIIVMAAFTAVPIAAFWYFTRKDRSRFEAALTPEERERLRGFCLLQSWQQFIPMTQLDCANAQVDQARFRPEVSPAQAYPPALGDDPSFPKARFIEPGSGVFVARQDLGIAMDPVGVRAPIRPDVGTDMPRSGADHADAQRPDPHRVEQMDDVHLQGVMDQQIAAAAPADVGERDRLREGGGDVSYSVEELRSKASFCRWKAATAGTEQEKDRWRQLADHWRQLARASADEADDQQPN